MPQFYPLRVTEICRDTRDSVIVTLQPPAEAEDEFAFIQGQYLTFRRTLHGEELRRSYSICSGINDGKLRVGIKRVEDGWFSTWANEELKVGDTLESMKPAGNFHADLAPASARRYLGVAGGSGITPLISVMKTVLEEEPHAEFTLLYGNRSASAIMFREELEDLKNCYMQRLNIVHVLETESDIDLFAGQLTRQKCDELFEHWVHVENIDYAFICGPKPMMTAVAEALRARGVDDSKLKFELFVSVRRGKTSKQAGAMRERAPGATCEATFILDGVKRHAAMPKEGQSVLEAAHAADLEAPFSCKAGVCSTCRAKVIEGDVEMIANFALEDYEVERGYVLTCQSYPLTDRLVVDYDQ